MAPSSLTERTLETLRREESKFVQALELFYSNFGSQNHISIDDAAFIEGAKVAFLPNYMRYCDAYIGVPETIEEAQKYLSNLLEYKAKRGL